ncbi:MULTISPECIES: hypothetical protein [Citrobacter]|uniref:hypothetical protein n=1 Tax=Citrobacter TaxID=544 RepID=UPI000F8C86C5|nr:MULTISPECIES: hypothetical protein [Citrobacter]EHU7373820.1 hypothetical protein [Citrobacter freundii]MDG9960275.1 hypothetical protein [Citrobacter portucalensis]MDM2810228.1 hypothetical protein [Citrobacter sp. Cpo103]MDN4357495.1 hypothetical protein [Citrobacter portucalensis]MDN4366122.1 hypothetical protein [Citrobacter portucalensis]
MIGAIFGVMIFIVTCFLFSYIQTIKRCRMFYYLECLKYALDFNKETEASQSLIQILNIEAKKLKLSKQSSILQEMDLYIQKNFNGNFKDFMAYARNKGFKG